MSKVELFILSAVQVSIEGIKNIIKPLKTISILGCTDSLEKAAQYIKQNPNVILFVEDTHLDGEELFCFLDGALAVKAKIIFFTESNDSSYLTKAITRGIRGILHKDASKDKIIEAILLVFTGGIYIDFIINISLSTVPVKEKLKLDYHKLLSKRELEVLNLISEGLKNSEIAEKLIVSNRTIEAHKTHILKKLNLKTSAELTLFAISKKLASIN